MSFSRLMLPSTGPELQWTGEAGVHRLPIAVEIPTEAAQLGRTGALNFGDPVGRQNLPRRLGCAFVDVVQPVEDRVRPDRACHWPERRFRGLQSKGPMRSLLVVVRHELTQDSHEVLLVQNDDVVEALSPQGANHSLHDGVRLGRVDRGRDRVDTEASGALAEVAAVHGIPIAQQMPWFTTPGCGLRSPVATPRPPWGWPSR
jgi:hypothetical protein